MDGPAATGVAAVGVATVVGAAMAAGVAAEVGVALGGDLVVAFYSARRTADGMVIRIMAMATVDTTRRITLHIITRPRIRMLQPHRWPCSNQRRIHQRLPIPRRNLRRLIIRTTTQAPR